jgi:hypothetical protein
MPAALPPIVRLSDFSGGLNIRDSQTSLGPNELSQALNITLDERGAISSRLGYSKWNVVSYGSSPIKYVFYWGFPASSAGHIFVQVGTSIYQDLSTTPLHTFSNSDRVAMADFAGKLCIVHPADGFFTYDLTTFSSIASGPRASSIASWQNKLWTNDLSGAPSRVNFCSAGDPTQWGGVGTSGFNDLRENDNNQIVNVYGTASPDIVGRPTLLVFKERSTYRIYEAATGAYQTLDSRVGTGGAMSVTALMNKILSISPDGIFQTDGASPLQAVGDQLRPLWNVGEINVSQKDLMAAGSYGKHAYFSIPKVGATANNLMLDFDITTGAITLNTNAMSCYTVHFNPVVNALLAGSPTVNGQLYQLLSNPTDDGASIVSTAQTRFTELNSGMKSLLNRVRINGRGSCTVYPLYNYDWTQTISRSISIPSSTGTVHGGYQDIYNLGRGNSFAFRFDSTNSTTANIPFGTGNPSDTHAVGAWGIYGVDFNEYAALGRA